MGALKLINVSSEVYEVLDIVRGKLLPNIEEIVALMARDI